MRMIDADELKNQIRHMPRTINPDLVQYSLVKAIIENMPTLTPPPASSDLISRSALLEGETEPEITTGSDSELAEHMEWERWMDKIKRAPAVDKEEEP